MSPALNHTLTRTLRRFTCLVTLKRLALSASTPTRTPTRTRKSLLIIRDPSPRHDLWVIESAQGPEGPSFARALEGHPGKRKKKDQNLTTKYTNPNISRVIYYERV
jgi:hypothetical protein